MTVRNHARSSSREAATATSDSFQVRCDLRSHQLEVIDVVEIEHLEVDAAGAPLLELGQAIERLRDRAGHAMLTQFSRLAADRGSAAAQFRLILPDGEHQRR